MTIRMGSLSLNAKEINLANKKADISELLVDQPFVMIYNYKNQSHLQQNQKPYHQK
jgi:hypothetical protein